ncbi:unannotated protein [freshwater metagenome]|uniref:Unannotated protein n=1 Tax=freshwater metagenome TaxID=449393 RepID=A0A6J7DJ97_9ZZZZ|nr:hypothetical protein [Actinomycetota bacterium]MUH58269.1 hypothetical protein [Actinomycetota bacterium]
MSSTPITDVAAAEEFARTLDAWSQRLLDDEMLLAAETGISSDGKKQWLLRFAGEEKQFVAIWMTLRQRTVYVEIELMPPPEENVSEVLTIAMAKNFDLYPLHLAIGPDNGMYLVMRFPVGDASSELFDEISGAALRYVDELFPTLMARGYASAYRRRVTRQSRS